MQRRSVDPGRRAPDGDIVAPAIAADPVPPQPRAGAGTPPETEPPQRSRRPAADRPPAAQATVAIPQSQPVAPHAARTAPPHADTAPEHAAPGRAPPIGKAPKLMPDALLTLAPPMYWANAEGRIITMTPAFETLANARIPRDAAANAATGLPHDLADVFDRLDAGEDEVNARHTVEIDGARRHFRSCHVRVVDGGSHRGYVGTYTDVTRETEAMRASAATEARYNDLIRSTSDWVWETDANLNLTYVSDRIAEALAVPAAALKGKYLFVLGEFEGQEDGPGQGPDIAMQLSPFRNRVFLMPDSRGKMRRIALSGVPVFDDASGRFTGYRGTGTDVTVRHEAEERAHQSQRQLEASLKALRDRNVQLDVALSEARSAVMAKTEFLGKMSHELRTPLNAIIGFSEMSIQQVFGSLNDRYLGYFTDIRSAAHHLLHIINDILDAVSIESAEVSISSRPVRLAEIIAEAKSIVAVRAEQQGLDLSQVAVDKRWTVMADPARARQIFVNLLNNAVKFTPRGGRIGVDVVPDEDNLLRITVWDTGVGIPADELDRIFESFHQVGSNVMNKPREGTGLGLTISQQLVRLMGGDIYVTSELGEGSRFSVLLPATMQLAQAGE